MRVVGFCSESDLGCVASRFGSPTGRGRNPDEYAVNVSEFGPLDNAVREREEWKQ